MLLHFLCLLFLVPAALTCLYYAGLAVYALTATQPKKPDSPSTPVTTFAIVIPAHNEEASITNTLESCAGLDYPADKFKVFVIADNCTDRTAEVAVSLGAECYERKDDQRRGKGHALEFAFEQILPQGYDAIVVIDADCLLDSHALRSFDSYLQAGDSVLQANDMASNPDESVMAYALGVGNCIENNLFCAAKSRLGLAVFLRGTGMVLSREILQAYPWQAHSIVEDAEYTLRLFRASIPVRFIPEVNVRSPFPVYNDQLVVQRTRWGDGNLSFGRKHAPKLLLEGMVQRRLLLADAGWTFLVLSRPLVLLQLGMALLFGAICSLIVPGPFSTALLAAGLCVALTQGLYFASGIVLLGLTRHRIRLLLGVPSVVFRLVVISLRGMFGARDGLWAKTPR